MTPLSGRAAASVLLAALVVLAGCNGVLGPGNEATPAGDDTVTPAPVPGTDGADGSGGTDAGDGTDAAAGGPSSGTPGSESHPPGVDADGIANLTALRAAHASVLRGESYAVDVTITNAILGYDDVRRTVRVRNRSTYLVTGDPNATDLVYVDPSGRYERVYATDDGAVTNVTGVVRYADGVEPAPVHVGFEFLTEGVANVTRVVRDGEAYYRVYATRRPDRNPGIDNFGVTAYVRPDGFVRTIVASFDQRLTPGWSHHVERYTYRAVGETPVAEPDWVREEKRERGVDLPPVPTPAADAPPGVAKNRVYNADALWAAHRAVLDGRSYAMVARHVGDGPRVRQPLTLAVENRTTYLQAANGTVWTYADPSGTYRRVPPDWNVGDAGEVRVYPPAPYRLDRSRDHGGGYLVANGSSVARVERNHTTYFRLRFTRSPPESPIPHENFSATALVRADGFVEHVTLNLTVPVSGSGAENQPRSWTNVTYRYTYRGVGNTTVTEPEWVGRAKRDGGAPERNGTAPERNGTRSPDRAAGGPPRRR